jgi:hypothetical protein
VAIFGGARYCEGSFATLSPMSTNDYPQYEKEIPQYEVPTQNHFKYTLPNSVSFGQILSASPTPNQITCQFSATSCADFSEEMSSWGCVNLPQLKVPPVSHSSRFSSPLSSESSLDGEEGCERSRLQNKTRNYLAKVSEHFSNISATIIAIGDRLKDESSVKLSVPERRFEKFLLISSIAIPADTTIYYFGMFSKSS